MRTSPSFAGRSSTGTSSATEARRTSSSRSTSSSGTSGSGFGTSSPLQSATSGGACTANSAVKLNGSSSEVGSS